MRISVRKAVPWAFVDTFSSTAIGVLTIILLSRVLTAEELGLISLVQSIVAIVALIVSMGLSDALIRKRPIDVDYDDTAFWGLLLLGGVAYTIVAIVAASMFFIGWSWIVCLVIVLEANVLLFNALNIMPAMQLERKLRIAQATKRTLVARGTYILVAIILSTAGFGLWSICAAGLAQNAVSTAVLWRLVARFPRRTFRWAYMKELVKFGAPAMLETAIWAVQGRILFFLVGVIHGLTALGFVTMAMRSTETIAGAFLQIANRLALPMMAQVQQDDDRLKQSYAIALESLMFITAPVFLGLMVTAKNWVPLFLGSEWSATAFPIQLLCCVWVVILSRAIVTPYLKALGHPKAVILPALAAAVVTVFALLTTNGLSLEYVILAWATRLLITVPAGSAILKKYGKISINDQFRPAIKPIVLSASMAVFVWLVSEQLLDLTKAVLLSLQIFLGLLLYASLSILVYRRQANRIFSTLVAKVGRLRSS